jgi:hypothetical protein
MRMVKAVANAVGGAPEGAPAPSLVRGGAGPIPPSRALATRGSLAESASLAPLTARARAPFLAHLIATRHQAPQTRVRRRAIPGEAIGAYRANLPRRPAVPSRLARSV